MVADHLVLLDIEAGGFLMLVGTHVVDWAVLNFVVVGWDVLYVVVVD